VNNEPAAFGLLRVQIIDDEEHTGYVKRRFRTVNTKVRDNLDSQNSFI